LTPTTAFFPWITTSVSLLPCVEAATSVLPPVIRLKANAVLEREIEHLLNRPVGRPSHQPKVFYHSFQYQAKSWEQSRRVVAKVERHRTTAKKGWSQGEGLRDARGEGR